MKLDFTVPVSAYELLALVLSVLALAIPLIKHLWEKWVIKAKIDFILARNAKLYFNQSGSYIQIDGVISSENKAVTIQKIYIVIKRRKDDKKLNLTWKRLISPVNQNLVGNYVLTTEDAHPIRVEANSIICTFAQYGDPFDSFDKKFYNNTSALFKTIPTIKTQTIFYDEAQKAFMSLPEYSEARNMMKTEFFWEIGKYDLDVFIDYNKESTKKYSYEFTVSEHEYNELIKNFDEALLSPLKSVYQQQWNYRLPSVELIERKAEEDNEK